MALRCWHVGSNGSELQPKKKKNIMPWESWFLLVNWQEQFEGNVIEYRCN